MSELKRKIENNLPTASKEVRVFEPSPTLHQELLHRARRAKLNRGIVENQTEFEAIQKVLMVMSDDEIAEMLAVELFITPYSMNNIKFLIGEYLER